MLRVLVHSGVAKTNFTLIASTKVYYSSTEMDLLVLVDSPCFNKVHSFSCSFSYVAHDIRRREVFEKVNMNIDTPQVELTGLPPWTSVTADLACDCKDAKVRERIHIIDSASGGLEFKATNSLKFTNRSVSTYLCHSFIIEQEEVVLRRMRLISGFQSITRWQCRRRRCTLT